MSKKNLLNNLFLHEKYFDTFFNQNLREKRLEDINNLSKFYTKNKLLKVTKDYSINQQLLEKWINSHKTENDKNISRSLMKPITYISFDIFYENLLYSTKKFNQYIIENKIKKYYLIIGANNAGGTDSSRYVNIEKSNFWTLLLIYPYLEQKPYDVVLNLNQALEFSIFDIIRESDKKNKKIKNLRTDFVFVDDASYSGSQLFNYTIGTELINKKYLDAIYNIQTKNTILPITKNNTEINKKEKNPNNFSSPLKKMNELSPSNVNIHIIVPYISTCAYELGNEIHLKKNINIHFYNNYLVSSYEKYYKYGDDILENLRKTYGNFGFYKNLIPLYFAHKMPDGVSTIDYILLSGIVVNNSDITKEENKSRKSTNLTNSIKKSKHTTKKYKYVQFIKNCIYPKNKLMKPSSLKKWGCNKLCPISPAKNIQNKIYDIMFSKNY